MAAALWRQWRVWGFQKLSVDTDIANHDGHAWYAALHSYVNPDTCMGTLLRYETAFGRQFSRAQKELVALRTRRAGVSPASLALEISGATWDRIDPANSDALSDSSQ